MMLKNSDYVRVDCIQAPEDSELERLFANYVTSVMVENEQRITQQRVAPIGIADVGLAACGDQFIFYFCVTDSDDARWTPAELGRVSACFWMGGDASSLADYHEAALASLRQGSRALKNIAMNVVGGKTRLMGFVAGVKTRFAPSAPSSRDCGHSVRMKR